MIVIIDVSTPGIRRGESPIVVAVETMQWPLSSGPILFCAPGPMLWQGEHFLDEFAPFATSCASPAPVDAAINAAAMISVLIMFPFRG
jgi:hypothetical protein